MRVGAHTASSVTPDYAPPFTSNGRIHRVIVDVSAEHVEDSDTQMRIALAKQ
jgi:arylsulfatase